MTVLSFSNTTNRHITCATQKFSTFFFLSYSPQQLRAEPHWLQDLPGLNSSVV